jgi:hypothetical protein
MTDQQRVRRRARVSKVGRRPRGAAAVRLMVVMTAGAVVVAGRAQAQADAMGIAPPRAVSAANAQAGLAVRTQRLRERYAHWQNEPAGAAHGDALPAPPSDAQAPPPPDAPGGEITQQLEEAGQ